MLTQRTEGKSPATQVYRSGILGRFLWFADTRGWSDDARVVDEWHIREFLGYVGTEVNRWATQGNGSESSSRRASTRTVHHYYSVLRAFFNWSTREGFLKTSPVTNVKVARPKRKLVHPYSPEQVKKMIEVCERDYRSGAKFLGSRNKVLLLAFLDTGLRLQEMAGLKRQDIDEQRGWITVLGKGGKQRVVRIGTVTQKALWSYLVHRGDNIRPEVWLTEERRPLRAHGIQAMIDSVKRRAGIDDGGGAHRFRHSFALAFLRSDRNAFNLQYLLGHETLDMTRQYISTLGQEDALKAHEQASPVDMLGLR